MSERVGLIGCGTVGTAVAKALLARGYRLVVHDKFAARPTATDDHAP